MEVCSLTKEEESKIWTLYTDGASSVKGVGAGLILIDPSGIEYTYAIRLTFSSLNNEAKYEALLAGLRIAHKMKVQRLEVKVDSKLVTCQMNGEFVASSEGMARYLEKAKEYAALFKKFSIKNIPRNQNQKADVLSKLASVAFNHLTKEILVEVLNAESVDVCEVNTVVEEEEDNWMTPIIKCLEKGIWPTDENKARTLQMKINEYVIEEGVMFKKSYLAPMLRCVGPLQANYIIREVHEGACGMHAGAREVVDKCGSCQIHAPVMRLSKMRLNSIMAPWPFHQWGLDILGPLLEGPDKLKYIVVAIDYFTKWIEAKPLAKITERRLDLDLIQERRETTAIREAKYKKKVEQYYNKRVCPVSFKVGDFVYRRNEASKVKNQGKLGPNWEGPYRVIEAYDNGSYKLATMNDREVPCTWHAINLHNCFM
ncbi:reverse transcriptase domain-containing protein [Tanacetum coccineum]